MSNSHISNKMYALVAFFIALSLLLAACSTGTTTTGPVLEQPPSGSQPSGSEQPPTGGEPSSGDQPNNSDQPLPTVSYAIVDTNQQICYDDNQSTACPQEGQSFYGQDAQYAGNQPSYVDNGDGTVTDLNTGLMWQQSYSGKMTWEEAVAGAETFSLAGYDDWRLPTIKELYSLIDFSGLDPSINENNPSLIPFIDTDYFDFVYGDESAGERIIDAQYWSATEYVASTMNGMATTFGVNFADGRIKGYGRNSPRGATTQYVRYVRGNPDYGVNDFVDNGDGTITDNATGLMWQQSDSSSSLDWAEALAYCENLTTGGYSDWRLPNAKELQSIVDYTRSPDTTNSAAIDPLFSVTAITNEAGQTDYAAFWSSTTHASLRGGQSAAYVAFGRAMGYMNNTWMDVHGAGAQRSDPKSGDPSSLPTSRGPQGDVVRTYNYARCVRDGAQYTEVVGSGTTEPKEQPPVSTQVPGGDQQPGMGQQPGAQAPPPTCRCREAARPKRPSVPAAGPVKTAPASSPHRTAPSTEPAPRSSLNWPVYRKAALLQTDNYRQILAKTRAGIDPSQLIYPFETGSRGRLASIRVRALRDRRL